jgi:hypothetical protein
MSVTSSIPKQWKVAIQTLNLDNTKSSIIEQIIKLRKPNKLLYLTHLKHNTKTINKSENKWNNIYENLEWPLIYMNPFRSTIDTKLRAFQYKFIKCILPANDFLLKCKIVNSSLCDLCNMHTETIMHLFWECPVSQAFWSDVSRFLHNNNIEIQLDYKMIALGLISQAKINNITNFILITAKYFLYHCKLNKSKPIMAHFLSEIKQRKQIESIIAKNKNKLATHTAKWSNIII